jgi:peptidyl-prolyl isomerase E (cyclophilin E)
VTFASSADAQDAIDNMDLNEMGGKVLKVNLARPMKGQLQAGGNRASELKLRS